MPDNGETGTRPVCIWECSEHPEHRGWRTYDEPRGTCDHCFAVTAFEHEVQTGGLTFTPAHPEGLWSPKGEDHETSDAVRERPTRHLPVNGPDDRQPNAPDRGQLRGAATPASGRGRSSEQGEDHEAGIEAALKAYAEGATRYTEPDILAALPSEPIHRLRLADAIAAYLSRVSALDEQSRRDAR